MTFLLVPLSKYTAGAPCPKSLLAVESSLYYLYNTDIDNKETSHEHN
jgi:hypothetical protein